MKLGGLPRMLVPRSVPFRRSVKLRSSKSSGLRLSQLIEPAIRAGERAVALDPEMAGAWNNLGTLYGSQGNHARALEVTRQALRLEPEFAEAHNNLGKVYFDLGELEEALSSYQRAIELRPSYLEAMVGRGLVLGELGSYREAVDAFSASSAMNPGALDHEALGYASRVAACRPGRDVFGKVWPLATAVRS